MMRSHQLGRAGHDRVRGAAHAGLHLLPALADQPAAEVRRLKSRLNAFNVHDAVMRLTEGGCDLLIAYHHPSQPLQLEPDRYEMLSLGAESLAPYARPGPDGQPLPPARACPGAARALPGYAPGAYMARLVDVILKRRDRRRSWTRSTRPTWPKA
jgi:hypothetical protein